MEKEISKRQASKTYTLAFVDTKRDINVFKIIIEILNSPNGDSNQALKYIKELPIYLQAECIHMIHQSMKQNIMHNHLLAALEKICAENKEAILKAEKDYRELVSAKGIDLTLLAVKALMFRDYPDSGYELLFQSFGVEPQPIDE